MDEGDDNGGNASAEEMGKEDVEARISSICRDLEKCREENVKLNRELQESEIRRGELETELHAERQAKSCSEACNTTMSVNMPSHDLLVQLIQRMRSTRARAPQGVAADIAYVLCVAQSVFPNMNAFQCNTLLQAFLARPKSTLVKTARSVLCSDARSSQLACPILSQLVELLDGIFQGNNWERSVVVFQGTQARIALARYMAELRLSYPDTYQPTQTEREASVLIQYQELYDVFADCTYVTTNDVNLFFKGKLKREREQTTLELAGPECWLALCRLMGYPAKPFCEYDGKFCTDHIVERSLYTKKSDRRETTCPDILSNYAMLLGVYNEQGRMKLFGMEKFGWYGTEWSTMAKTSLGFRLDFQADNGRVSTTADFTKSTWCKEEWKPRTTLLDHWHNVHARGRKRKAQTNLDSFVVRDR